MMIRNGLRVLLFALFILLFSHSPSGADTTCYGNFGDVVAEVENYLTSGMTFDKIAACHAKQD